LAQDVLYATLRAPVEDGKPGFYGNQWGQALRVGVARLEVGKFKLTWADIRRLTLRKERSQRPVLRVDAVEEFGALESVRQVLSEPSEGEPMARDPDERFASEINRRLAAAKNKDIFLYVHGYNVGFENPVLVASELWHYLAYDGVAIAFSWPSNRGFLVYLRDTEGAVVAAFTFRHFLEYLAKATDVRRIHVIGYSAGTRLVAASLGQLALRYHDTKSADIRKRLRLGNVMLVGGDVDRGLVGAYIDDGALRLSEQLAIYVSETDSALDFSRNVFSGRDRLGQMIGEGFSPHVTEFIRRQNNLAIIDVSKAEESDTGNGHHYFRQSPWVSSDVLTTLSYGLDPAQRGLIRDDEAAIWHFPADYIERLRAAVVRANPALAKPKRHRPAEGGG
jgi:esterase/lipase superfamily enzyme